MFMRFLLFIVKSRIKSLFLRANLACILPYRNIESKQTQKKTTSDRRWVLNRYKCMTKVRRGGSGYAHIWNVAALLKYDKSVLWWQRIRTYMERDSVWSDLNCVWLWFVVRNFSL